MINKEDFVKSIRKDLGIELYEEMKQSYCSDFSELEKIEEDIFRKPSNKKSSKEI